MSLHVIKFHFQYLIHACVCHHDCYQETTYVSRYIGRDLVVGYGYKSNQFQYENFILLVLAKILSHPILFVIDAVYYSYTFLDTLGFLHYGIFN